ncbi:radical SAM family heme chaperone HemW [Oscillospiraceae bacterium LTW-04]|nr:radical SAM family heme chaperone HemW [Oscillospiraceae bacterium MB24-C1]
MTGGIYLHVPFCTAKCPYCDFYSQRGTAEDYDRYLTAILRAIDGFNGTFEADTIYFGGGTPVLLGAERLISLLNALKHRFGESPLEVTIEANPCAVDESFLRQLTEGGFNRISFGVQSMNDETLHTLGRRHSAGRAEEMILAADRAGFEHISADLMLAVPGQRIEEVDASIKALAALPIDHLSAYLLKIEQGTFFAKHYADPDEDFAADCYLKMVESCLQHGFAQYEISNFSKGDSAQSLHNLKYWRCQPYLGIGPAAHSFYNGRRFYFPRNFAAFTTAESPWDITVYDGSGGDENERLMLGLRLSEGIRFDSFSTNFVDQIKKKASPLGDAGLLTLDDMGISLTAQGFLLSNAVISALL